MKKKVLKAKVKALKVKNKALRDIRKVLETENYRLKSPSKKVEEREGVEYSPNQKS
jgi:cell division protein FtsB